MTSEWVSLGHPDKMADYISSYLLDRYLERDPLTRYAVEVMIKDRHVILGGEVTSRAEFSNAELTSFAQTAVNRIGYDRVYQDRFGAKATICGDELIVHSYIGHQSPDIAQGVASDGWGDQGIFWGMATRHADYLPADYWWAREFGRSLCRSGIGGIDIKTLVTTDRDGRITEATCAVPTLPGGNDDIMCFASEFFGRSGHSPRIIVNGTGSYRIHGPVGDCGVTGRKLAVDFYGGNCRIGGGSPWTKDGTKADLSLNLYARRLAIEAMMKHGLETCRVAVSCVIGRPEIGVAVMDGNHAVVEEYRANVPPSKVIELFGLRRPRFAERCAKGLFFDV